MPNIEVAQDFIQPLVEKKKKEKIRELDKRSENRKFLPLRSYFFLKLDPHYSWVEHKHLCYLQLSAP